MKLAFYAGIGTRELVVVDRYPWCVELYRLRGEVLELVGASDAANGAVLASEALPLTFQLRAGEPRPTIHITHAATGQTWTA